MTAKPPYRPRDIAFLVIPFLIFAVSTVMIGQKGDVISRLNSWIRIVEAALEGIEPVQDNGIVRRRCGLGPVAAFMILMVRSLPGRHSGLSGHGKQIHGCHRFDGGSGRHVIGKGVGGVFGLHLINIHHPLAGVGRLEFQ